MNEREKEIDKETESLWLEYATIEKGIKTVDKSQSIKKIAAAYKSNHDLLTQMQMVQNKINQLQQEYIQLKSQ